MSHAIEEEAANRRVQRLIVYIRQKYIVFMRPFLCVTPFIPSDSINYDVELRSGQVLG